MSQIVLAFVIEVNEIRFKVQELKQSTACVFKTTFNAQKLQDICLKSFLVNSPMKFILWL